MIYFAHFKDFDKDSNCNLSSIVRLDLKFAISSSFYNNII